MNTEAILTPPVQYEEGSSQFDEQRRPDGVAEFDLRALLAAFARQKYLIAGVSFLGIIAAGASALLIPGRYKSEVVVLVQPVGNLAEPNGAVGQATPELVRSQLEVVQSQRVLGKVVDDLKLAGDPEFEPKRSLADANAPVRRAAVIANVARRLDVDNDGRSVTIHIAFAASTAAKAAQITEAIANEYVRVQGEMKGRAIAATKDRLDKRLADLRLATFNAEATAENFRRQAGLITLSSAPEGADDMQGATYPSKLLGELSRQTAELTAQSAIARARASSAAADLARNGGRSTPEVLSSPVISSLLEQDALLAKSEASLASRYTSENRLLIEAREQRRANRYALSQAMGNIERSLRSQAQSASAALGAATGRANELEGLINRQLSNTVQYRQLQREAKLKRQTYEQFATEAGNISERALLQLPDAQLVSPASMPIKQSWPNRPIIFLGGSLLALLLAFGLAILREFRNLRIA